MLRPPRSAASSAASAMANEVTSAAPTRSTRFSDALVDDPALARSDRSDGVTTSPNNFMAPLGPSSSSSMNYSSVSQPNCLDNVLSAARKHGALHVDVHPDGIMRIVLPLLTMAASAFPSAQTCPKMFHVVRNDTVLGFASITEAADKCGAVHITCGTPQVGSGEFGVEGLGLTLLRQK